MKTFSTVRLFAAAALAVTAMSQGACNKPTPDECKKALTNMQQLMGTEAVNTPSTVAAATRRCRGASKKESVNCAAKATTLDELKQCAFYKELMSSSMFPEVTPPPKAPMPATPLPTPVTPPAGAPAAAAPIPTPAAPPAGAPIPTTPASAPPAPAAGK